MFLHSMKIILLLLHAVPQILNAVAYEVKLTTTLHLSTKGENAWSCTSFLPHVFMVCHLIKHKINFSLPLFCHMSGTAL